MSYQVLYRAWRPGTFSEIVGQDAVVHTLRRQVISGHIAHAYLFCGTRGTGKTTASKVLARAINCLSPRDGDPCGECEVCRAILADSCMDVIEIDAASNNGVDEIRDLRDKVKYPPTLARYKVYIIDEVHMLSTGAFNALLKTLEEPPVHAVFILATTEPHKLPATILSRCQRFDFHRIPAETIAARMRTVLHGVGREADEDALMEIARAAEGALRDALSLLDGCLAATDGPVTLQVARDVLGTTGRAFIFEFVDALIDFDAAKALLLINDMMDRGSDPQVFGRDVTAHLRALLLADAVGDVAELLEITREDAARFSEQTKRVPAQRLMRLMDLFMNIDGDMRRATRPRTLLELAAVRACHPEKEPDAGMDERIARVEKMLEGGAVPARAARAAQPSTPAAGRVPENAGAGSAPPAGKDAPEPPQEYLQAMEVFSTDAAFVSIRTFLQDLRFVSCEEDTVTAEVPRAKKMSLAILDRKKKDLEKALSGAFGRPMKLTLREEGARPAAAGGMAAITRRNIEIAENVFGRDKLDLTD